MTPYQQPGSSLNVDVALGDGDALAFRAIGEGSFGRVYRGSWRGGSTITLIGDNFGSTRSLSVNSSGAVGFVGTLGASRSKVMPSSRHERNARSSAAATRKSNEMPPSAVTRGGAFGVLRAKALRRTGDRRAAT